MCAATWKNNPTTVEYEAKAKGLEKERKAIAFVEDAAASLGLGPWRVCFQVVLPQLRLRVTRSSRTYSASFQAPVVR